MRHHDLRVTAQDEEFTVKVRAIIHLALGFRMTCTYIANIYHCCAELPLP